MITPDPDPETVVVHVDPAMHSVMFYWSGRRPAPLPRVTLTFQRSGDSYLLGSALCDAPEVLADDLDGVAL